MKQASFRLRLLASRSLQLAVAAAHVIGALSILAANMVPLAKAVLLLCVGASLAAQRAKLGAVDVELRPDGTIQRSLDERNLSVGAGDTLTQKDTSGDWLPIALDSRTRILGPLIVMLFPPESRLRPMALLPDSFASIDDYRCLRIWLKWTSSRGISSKGPWSGHGLQDRI